jgi:acetamidase/formamidase
MDVLSYRPDPAEFAWTFGGVPPVRLVSRVVEFPFVNPQTGPFYVEGAEPGDTLAIHFVSIEPSRDWAASSTIPLFGSLTGTHVTALLQEPLDEVVWMYEVDRARRTVTFRARRGDLAVELPLDPMRGTVGVAPASFEARSSLVPDAHGGNMDTPEMRAGVTCCLGVNLEGALFSIGDGHCLLTQAAELYGGMHRRRRELGREYLGDRG